MRSSAQTARLPPKPKTDEGTKRKWSATRSKKGGRLSAKHRPSETTPADGEGHRVRKTPSATESTSHARRRSITAERAASKEYPSRAVQRSRTERQDDEAVGKEHGPHGEGASAPGSGVNAPEDAPRLRQSTVAVPQHCGAYDKYIEIQYIIILNTFCLTFVPTRPSAPQLRAEVHFSRRSVFFPTFPTVPAETPRAFWNILPHALQTQQQKTAPVFPSSERPEFCLRRKDCADAHRSEKAPPGKPCGTAPSWRQGHWRQKHANSMFSKAAQQVRPQPKTQPESRCLRSFRPPTLRRSDEKAR